MQPIQSNWSVFHLDEKARAFEQGRTVSEDGALSPIFEEITPRAVNGAITGILLTISYLSSLPWQATHLVV